MTRKRREQNKWKLSPFVRDCEERRGNSDVYVDQIMQWGYLVEDCSPWHVKIFVANEKPVEFWPTKLKWYDPAGFKFEAHGKGMESLKAYLDKYKPLLEERKPS